MTKQQCMLAQARPPMQWRSQAGSHWGTCPSNWKLCPTRQVLLKIIGAECTRSNPLTVFYHPIISPLLVFCIIQVHVSLVPRLISSFHEEERAWGRKRKELGTHRYIQIYTGIHEYTYAGNLTLTLILTLTLRCIPE